jgi:hypothetical protein
MGHDQDVPMSQDEVWHIAEIVLSCKKTGKPQPSDVVWLMAEPERALYMLNVLAELNDLR